MRRLGRRCNELDGRRQPPARLLVGRKGAWGASALPCSAGTVRCCGRALAACTHDGSHPPRQASRGHWSNVCHAAQLLALRRPCCASWWALAGLGAGLRGSSLAPLLHLRWLRAKRWHPPWPTLPSDAWRLYADAAAALPADQDAACAALQTAAATVAYAHPLPETCKLTGAGRVPKAACSSGAGPLR